MKKVKSVLWRKLNQATLDTLRGKSSGQYHVTLGATLNLDGFLNAFIPRNPTEKKGYEYKVALEPYNDLIPANSIGSSDLTIKYMGEESARADWNIPAQRPSTAYPMWNVQRRVPPTGTLSSSFLCIIRTQDDKYYGRLILEDEINNVPLSLRSKMLEKEMGIISTYVPSLEAEEIYNHLLTHFNVLLYGPPGTGKTTLMQEVVELFNAGGVIYFDDNREIDPFVSSNTVNSNKHSIWTTFHQSYSYEEFIIGLSTESSDPKKLLSINPKAGVLLELAEYARKPDHSSLLVIDELNRGNVSRIFGEFITLIEPDKRLDQNGKVTSNTVKIRLPYVKYGETLNFNNENGIFSFTNPCTMPKNVYTLASMNSIDKSIFPLDSALRRRFYRYDIMPNLNLLAKVLKINLKEINNPDSDDLRDYTVKDVRNLSWKLMDYFNRKIVMFLGNDYTLGHSYFWPLSRKFNSVEDIVDELTQIFLEKVYPQLEELFRGRLDIIEHIFKIEKLSTFSPFEIVVPTSDEEEYGAVTSFTLNKDKFYRIELINRIRWFQDLSEIDLLSPVAAAHSTGTSHTTAADSSTGAHITTPVAIDSDLGNDPMASTGDTTGDVENHGVSESSLYNIHSAREGTSQDEVNNQDSGEE
jgi:5-methylcytosine-specific restriction enzyme B